MSDKDIGQTKPVLQFAQQIHDLYLRVRIQRGDRFVKQDDLRLAGDRTRDADALQLAAGKLMGKPVSKMRRADRLAPANGSFSLSVQLVALPAAPVRSVPPR